MDTPHPNEVVKFCPQCGCKTWTDVDGNCEWSDMHQNGQSKMFVNAVPKKTKTEIQKAQ